MESHPDAPRDSKRSDRSPPGDPQPVGTEVESARLLANKAREELEADGMSEQQVIDLAEEFVAEHPNADPAGFVAWARARDGR